METIIIKAEIDERWVSKFLTMLKTMQFLGNIGSSREITFYSDGDGDFRPKFQFDKEIPIEEIELEREYFFDAG